MLIDRIYHLQEVLILTTYKYIYGPVPSRRLGLSLGISPIPKKYCNYTCSYCQLGRTDHLTNTRESYFNYSDIVEEFKNYIKNSPSFDVITIVGEGEPTLYLNLGDLIGALKKLTNKPIAVITNGALLSSPQVQAELMAADIVLPSLDAFDIESFKRINRPHGSLSYHEIIEGLIKFSHRFSGQIWIEIMLVKNENDSTKALTSFKALLSKISYQRLFINTPIRPPAEKNVMEVSDSTLKFACELLGGTSIEQLASQGFYSDIKDDFHAVCSIIQRHPMNQFEIEHFLLTRKCKDTAHVFNQLSQDCTVDCIEYKGYKTYRK
jgi:wyosine [tRNA(Phe)-imidazoG37] synthetase (radical SAM superfamily)